LPVAAVQIGLFRNVGDLAYLPVATTGNMMRFMESAYDSFVEKRSESRRAVLVYGTLILAFGAGALMGAIASDAWGVHAIWLPAGFLAITLCFVHRRGAEVIYDPGMRRRLLAFPAVVTSALVGIVTVSAADAEPNQPPSCSFTLTPPQLVQVSGAD
jgi:Protein of unknown function (DUF1275)